jgi:glycosyltransferase involved in cell wall biosynthesis
MIGNYLSTTRHNRNVWHDMADRLAAAGWNVITTSSKEGQLPRLLDMLATVIKSRKHYALAQIDVFSGRAFIFAELSAFLLKIFKKPFVLTLHGGRIPEFAHQHPRRVCRLFQSAQVIVTPSPFIKNSLKKFRSDIRIIPNPIELSTSLYHLRKQVKPNLIWVRAFHAIYNPSLTVRVLKELIIDFPQIKLMMIGPDKRDGSLRDLLVLANDFGVQGQIEVIRGVPHSEIPGFLDRNDIFINTSNYDTAPSSLLEAMANGLCIVSTNVGGIPWMVDDQVDALLVPPDNPQAMAGAVRRILTEPGLSARLSKKARLKSEIYDWDVMFPQWEGLFMEVIKAFYD